MQNLSYEEVIEQIENKRRFGNLTGVEITAKMLEAFSHPEQGMKFIHIAGTNGKGSVSAFLCSILQEAGLKVGMFTSPHLVDFRERIRINGKMIEKEDAGQLGEMLLSTDFGVCPTMFDYCLIMAVLYFKQQKCDVAVIETGLGGRLDSTNALGVPAVSVITKIGYDHMAILGETLPEIAAEKAGIIKTGTKLVLESQEAEAKEVFLEKIKACGIKEYQFVDMDALHGTVADGVQCFSYKNHVDLKMKLLGVHQYENAAAAVLAAEYFLKESHAPEKVEAAVRKGIANARWKGRMEVMSKEPFFLIDGAHNSNGVDALKRSLMALYPGEKFHFIMGVMADKDYELMVEMLLPLAIDFKTVTVESERALQGEKLAEYICKQRIPAESIKSLEEALSSITNKDRTIAFGSLYFIGEIEDFYEKRT